MVSLFLTWHLARLRVNTSLQESVPVEIMSVNMINYFKYLNQPESVRECFLQVL